MLLTFFPPRHIGMHRAMTHDSILAEGLYHSTKVIQRPETIGLLKKIAYSDMRKMLFCVRKGQRFNKPQLTLPDTRCVACFTVAKLHIPMPSTAKRPTFVTSCGHEFTATERHFQVLALMLIGFAFAHVLEEQAAGSAQLHAHVKSVEQKRAILSKTHDLPFDSQGKNR